MVIIPGWPARWSTCTGAGSPPQLAAATEERSSTSGRVVTMPHEGARLLYQRARTIYMRWHRGRRPPAAQMRMHHGDLARELTAGSRGAGVRISKRIDTRVTVLHLTTRPTRWEIA